MPRPAVDRSPVHSQGDESRPSPTNPLRSPSMSAADRTEGSDKPQKKRRLNRPITSCVTCRRLKTRCEIIPGRRACQRCISLRLDCDLPAMPDSDDTSVTAVTADPALQLRLSHIEQSLEKLTSLVQTVIDHSILQATPSAQAPSASLPIQPIQPAPSFREPIPPPRQSNGESLSGVTRPVLLVRNLQTQFFGPKRDFGDEQLAVGSVVSAGIITPNLAQSLIRIFVKRNGPWVSMMSLNDLPSDIEQRHPLLFSTMCLLAARHVPRVTQPIVHEMNMSVRRLVSSVVFKAAPLDYEALQALTILCLFTPTIQTAMPIDSWMVSSIAMNHATLAFGFTSPEAVPADGTEEQLRRLRIWNAVCLTNIQFAIGNGRPCMVQPRFVNQGARIMEFPNARTMDARLYAEVVLYARTEAILTSGLGQVWQQTDITVFPELVDFKAKWSYLLPNPECLSLRFGYWYCHLLLYRASLRGTQTDIESAALRDAAIKMSSAILELFLETEFSIILDMPDHFFFIIIYAGLTMCKFAIGHHLIAAAQNCFMDLAPNEEHISYRFGTILAEIRRKAAAVGATGLDPETGEKAEGSEESIPQQQPMLDFLPGNDDYTWDAFLGWSTMVDMGLAMGLEDAVAYGPGGLDPGFNPG